MKTYYQDDWVTIYHGDCREILPQLPMVDLVLTSPPYNFDAGSGIGHKYDFKSKGYKDNYTQEEYYQQQSDIVELLLAKTALAFYNIQMVAGNKEALLRLMGDFCDFIKEIIIWDKCFAEPAINDGVLNSQFEFILVFSTDNKRKFQRCFFERGTQSNVFAINKNVRYYGDKYTNVKHFAMMPEKLASKILGLFSTSGDVALDPFLGMGTTAFCAKKLNRKCIGIEIEEKYCEMAAKRCSQSVMNLNI
jgi:DNA modification methylase